MAVLRSMTGFARLRKLTDAGEGVKLKSGVCTVRLSPTVYVRLPLTPVTRIEYTPPGVAGVVDRVSTAEPSGERGGPKLAVTPAAGITVAERPTGRENPFSPVTVMVEFTSPPAVTFRAPGAADSVKLGVVAAWQ